MLIYKKRNGVQNFLQNPREREGGVEERGSERGRERGRESWKYTAVGAIRHPTVVSVGASVFRHVPTIRGLTPRLLPQGSIAQLSLKGKTSPFLVSTTNNGISVIIN